MTLYGVQAYEPLRSYAETDAELARSEMLSLQLEINKRLSALEARRFPVVQALERVF